MSEYLSVCGCKRERERGEGEHKSNISKQIDLPRSRNGYTLYHCPACNLQEFSGKSYKSNISNEIHSGKIRIQHNNNK